MKPRILKIDKGLKPYEGDIALRMELFRKKLAQLGDLRDFANGHRYFGFHKTESGWYYREWAPGAQELYLTGDFNNWQKIPMKKLENGVFELFLPGCDALKDGDQVQTIVISGGKELVRICMPPVLFKIPTIAGMRSFTMRRPSPGRMQTLSPRESSSFMSAISVWPRRRAR